MSAIILLVLRIILVVLLYAFLGWGLYLLWRDIKYQEELIAAQQAPKLGLTVLGDEDLPQHAYAQMEVIIGRSLSCDMPLDDPAVSSRHARLSYHQGQWWLEDLGSTNGTFLNGEMIETAVVVTEGDEMRLGLVNMKIEMRELQPRRGE